MSFSGWSYKQTHSITHGTGLTDYQVQFTVYKASETSSGSSIYCNTHCNDDFSDIRFSVDDVTALPYWIESYISGVSAVIWVKLPTIGTTTVSVFYGNAVATSESNGDATFVFFDDFAGTTLDAAKWAVSLANGTRTIANSVISFVNSTVANNYNLIKAITDTDNATVITGIKHRGITLNDDSSGSRVGIKYGTPPSGACVCMRRQSGVYQIHTLNEAVAWGSFIQNFSLNTWYTLELRHNYTSTFYWRFAQSGAWGSWAINPNPAGGHISIGCYRGPSGTSAIDYDWVYQRQYAATEPTQGSWGGEIYVGGTGVFVSANPSSGTPPLSTSISVLVSDPITNFELLFGDGQSYTSTSQESFATTHIYNTFGTYQVYASGYSGTKFYEDYAAVIVSNNSLTASFTKVQTLNNVAFTDTSTGSPNEWFWDFGDGANSTNQNPTHTYELPGTYIVTLYASNQEYNGYATTSITIANPIPTIAITSHLFDDYTIPSKVQFSPVITTNTTLHESITSILWDTQNGSTYTVYNPITMFVAPGTYNVSCTITNNYGEEVTAYASLTVGAAPIANFKPAYLNIISGTVPVNVQFTNLSSNGSSYLWAFNDGTTSTDTNPLHAFPSFGIHSVSLTTTNAYGTDTKTYANCIKIHLNARYFYDVITIAENAGPIQSKLLADLIWLSEARYAAMFLRELVTAVQAQIPEGLGIDETSDRSPWQNLDEWGHLITSGISEIGHRLLKIAGYSDHTGFKIIQAKVLEDKVIIEETWSND